MVAAANPHAAEAGRAVLARGGSAVDAAVAVQAVLSLVEPQSSGLGGGAFLLVYTPEDRRVHAYDGRETAPAGATPELLLDAAGKPLPFEQAVVSGRATGVPGAVALLGEAHARHGALPWSALFDDAVRLAEEGFLVSPRLSSFINDTGPQNAQPDVQAYFREGDGTLMETGDRLRNPAYAATLRALASGGPRAFYEGPLAEALVARVRQEPLPGTLSLEDVRGYRPRQVEPVCTDWRAYRVCVPPPPSSGVSLLQALELLEGTDVAERGPQDARAWFLLAEASRLMYADRDRYVGDPAFVAVPVAGLLDPAYVRARAALIGEAAGPPPAAGTPPGAGARGADATREPAGTSHFVVVDARGTVVSMTTSVESYFGSGRMAGGFFLNNQLTDFSFRPLQQDGTPAANAAAPGKRPRSSMSPVVVLDREGRFVAALGSPGGSSILAYNLKTLLGVLDWELSMQQAIDLPNLVARGKDATGDAELFAPAVLEGLRARGLEVRKVEGEVSGLHGVIARPSGLEGGADRRREGVVLSE
jgi:gamma-glutamyltranspeptidase/glutathione hydrolase